MIEFNPEWQRSISSDSCEIHMSEYNKLIELFEKVNQPIRKKLIQYNLNKLEPLWKIKYNEIKDQSWPVCDSIKDFNNLPEYIQKECSTIHGFSPDIWEQNILDDTDEEIVLPYKDSTLKIISDCHDFVAGHDIVDFACNNGKYSFAALTIGANSVVGFDIRDDNILLANAVKTYLKIPDDKAKFVKLDIHDYNNITNICTNKSTALILGVLYHVHDHYEILSAVRQADVTNIIIETNENDCILSSKEPLVWWRSEPTFENVAG